MNINDFYKYEKPGRKISMVTAYDHALGQLAEESAADCVLVGDSLAMVMHGFESTIDATPELMALHTAAVTRAVKSKLVVADMPFMSVRKGLAHAMDSVEELVRAGAGAVKIEGVTGHAGIIAHIVSSDIPVMGHIGLTPQSVRKFGGYRAQGRDAKSAERLVNQALELEQLGCFALVLECVPASLARRITALVKVPVIGIGAGPHTDGQVLVMHDLLGLYKDAPSFAKKYLDGRGLVAGALDSFSRDVRTELFPGRKINEDDEEHSGVAEAAAQPAVRG